MLQGFAAVNKRLSSGGVLTGYQSKINKNNCVGLDGSDDIYDLPLVLNFA